MNILWSRMESEDIAELRGIAKMEGHTLSSLVRKVLCDYLYERQAKKKRGRQK